MLVVETSWILVLALVAMRLAAMLALTPIFTAFPIPAQFRIVLIVALAAALAGSLPIVPSLAARSAGQVFVMAMSELVMGMLLAIGIFSAFSAFSFAGRVLDIQIGFGIAQLYDPVSRTEIPILTSVFSYAAVVLFFLLDGHHALLRGIAYTLAVIPPGQFTLESVNAGRLVVLTGKTFSLGFMLVAPVIFCVFIVEAGLAMLARGLPQMNMFVISLPVKIVTGLLALSFWAKHMPAGIARVYALVFDIWSGAFY